MLFKGCEKSQNGDRKSGNERRDLLVEFLNALFIYLFEDFRPLAQLGAQVFRKPRRG